MIRCGSFQLLSAPHYLFSIWTNLKRSEKIPGAPTRRWEEWIWLTGPSGLHRNSPQGLNISYIRFLTRSEIRKFLSPFAPYIYRIYIYCIYEPWWNRYLTPVVNFFEVRRAPLANPLSSPSCWCPWDLFRSFKVCSDDKERVGCRKQREATAPVHP